MIGVDAWEERDYMFDPSYKTYTCLLCVEVMKDRVYNPKRKSDTIPYRTGRVTPGSSRANEAQASHLRDKHGVIK